MKRVEKYIPDVLEILHTKFPNGKIQKVYNGYISSFGASVMMSGLRSTVAMFESNTSSSEADRKKIVDIILEVLKKENNIIENSLLEYIVKFDNDKYLKNKILDIATAMKLCIRTFDLKD
ncbi:type III-B CRISPR module-associated protein Cmr5 [Nautilia lithotrophica]